MSIGALVLAAGFSRRLGRPKQDVILNGETLLARAVRVAQRAGLDPICAVVREERWIDCLSSTGATVLLNEHAHEGMASSLVAGVAWAQAQNLTGLVLMTCDQPGLRPEHLRALCVNPNRITGSFYAGRTGVPAFFPSAAFPSLLQLNGDTGARHLLRDAAAITDESLALDIDTEQDLALAQQCFGHQRG